MNISGNTILITGGDSGIGEDHRRASQGCAGSDRETEPGHGMARA